MKKCKGKKSVITQEISLAAYISLPIYMRESNKKLLY